MQNGKVISFCGLDGTGKTTMFNLLKKKLNSNEFIFIPRGSNEVESIITKYYPRKYLNENDWLNGDFANAIALACAIDFHRYYTETILPAINTGKLIITDRYSTCFLAYSMCIKKGSSLSKKLLKQIPPPDYIIFLTCDNKTLSYRLNERSSKNKHQFDSRNCQHLFLNSYLKLFRNYSSKVYKVKNNNTIEDTMNKILKIVWNVHNF